MNRFALILLPALAAPALALAQPGAQSTPTQDAARQCFWARNVDGFQPVKGERDKLRITVNTRDVFELDVVGCPNADLAFHVALVARGASNYICNPLDAELIVPSEGIGPQRCQISAMRRVTPAQLAAEDAAAKAASAARTR